MAHCRCCCRTFSTVKNFDLHRVGNVDTRKCADPGTLKDQDGKPLLELRTSGATPTWAAPSDPDFDQRFGRAG